MNHSGPFPIVFFLLPPSTPFPPYPYYIPLQVQSSPLFSFFSPFFFASLWSLCELMFGGISVAGPHPSQTTAWMVPCSVQSSALQFCHNEHQICGGWRGSPPQQSVVLARRRKGEAIGEGFLMGWIVPCLNGGNWGQTESVRFQGLTWRRIYMWYIYLYMLCAKKLHAVWDVDPQKLESLSGLCTFCDAHPLLCCYGDCCSLV